MSDKSLIRMVFKNRDATPKTVSIICQASNQHDIAAWYGSFFAGDNYDLKIDGKRVRLDQNGQIAA